MRLFIAINLPDDWKELLSQPQESIGWLGRGVRWVDPKGIHLTLKFLGDVEESLLAELNGKIGAVCGNYSAFLMQINATGVFPSPNKPRVFWAGLKAPESLNNLQSEIEASVERLGFEPEARLFRPHLTLARIKDPIGKKRITDAFLKYKLRSEPFTFSKVSLMRSHLSRDGATYEELAYYPLATTI